MEINLPFVPFLSSLILFKGRVYRPRGHFVQIQVFGPIWWACEYCPPPESARLLCDFLNSASKLTRTTQFKRTKTYRAVTPLLFLPSRNGILSELKRHPTMTVPAALLLSILCLAKKLDVRVELGSCEEFESPRYDVNFYFPDRYTVDRCSLTISNMDIGEVTFRQVQESLLLRADSLRQQELDRQDSERKELLERLNLSDKDMELLGLHPLPSR